MPPRLRTVSDAPRRGIALIRVSKVAGRGEDLLSPTLQRTAISDHAARHGIDIIEWVEALDESASAARSPWWRRLDDAVTKVESGQLEVVVVWKFSRAARHRRRWAVAIDRIEVAGGSLESATEDLDARTSAGRLGRGVLAEVAAFEADVKSEQWRETHADRIRRGLPAHGGPRWGYVYDRATGYRPDEKLGPVLADLYRRYTAGESAGNLCRWLNQYGLRTTRGNRWEPRVLLGWLDRGFGAGLLFLEQEKRYVPGVQEPVVTEAEWKAYLVQRASQRQTPSGSKQAKYPLSGLVRCGCCGDPMYLGPYGRGGVLRYRCKRLARRWYEVGVEPCPGRGSVRRDVVEPKVLEWLAALVADIDEAAKLAKASEVRRLVAEQDTARLHREITALDKALARLTVSHATGLVPDKAYADARDEMEAVKAPLVAQLEMAEYAVTRPAPDFDVYRGLLVEWDTIPVARRRQLLGELVAFVEVVPGRVPRVRVVPRSGVSSGR